MSASQTAHQAGPARPHLRHLQQGVQEQLQPAAAPVGAHGHQDEGPGSPGEGGRSEGRPGGEADGPNPNPIPSTNQVRKNHACEACGKAFRDVYHLNRHRLSHSDEKPYSCPICQQRFKRKDRMSYHVRSHQGGVEKPYICPHCAKQLRLILKTSLVSSTPSCFPQTCTSAFATRDRLRAHLIRHEEKVPCHICGKLLSAAYITDHMRVHNQSQHHACHLCNRSKTRLHHEKAPPTICRHPAFTCLCALVPQASPPSPTCLVRWGASGGRGELGWDCREGDQGRRSGGVEAKGSKDA
uniref:MYC-associated zinc finger protein a (purine-binding transcription factor) n=1 Tax=Oreochromis niloticus TaxID=8128 RepID=A0A669BTM4_ORENI